MPLKVAVVGAGRMGNHHARKYAAMEDCELLAVVDKDSARAEKVAGEHGGKPMTSIESLPGAVDAVTVAVPTVYHAAVAIPLLERGIPVLVEKPLAGDIASARQLLDASTKHGTLLHVGHSERFNPVVQAMLRFEVTPRFIETHRISPFTFRSADVGVVFDMMIHDIDIVLHLVREREYTVDVAGVNVLGEHEDVANARVRFAGGSVVNLTASRLALKTERKIRIFCPSAYISMDYGAKAGIAIKLDDNLDLIRLAREKNFDDLSQMQDLNYGEMIKVEPLVVDHRDALETEIRTFLQAVRTGDSPGVGADEGFRAVEMAERITKAVEQQEWGRELGQE